MSVWEIAQTRRCPLISIFPALSQGWSTALGYIFEVSASKATLEFQQHSGPTYPSLGFLRALWVLLFPQTRFHSYSFKGVQYLPSQCQNEIFPSMTQGKWSSLNNLTTPKSLGIYRTGLWLLTSLPPVLFFGKSQIQSHAEPLKGKSTATRARWFHSATKETQWGPASCHHYQFQPTKAVAHRCVWHLCIRGRNLKKAVAQLLAQRKVRLEPRPGCWGLGLPQLGLENFKGGAVSVHCQH